MRPDGGRVVSAPAHYLYASGARGCLPQTEGGADDREGAAEALLDLFGDDLTEEEAGEMRANLLNPGFHSFRDSAAAGADYAEVRRCRCEGGAAAHGEESSAADALSLN